VRLDDAGAWPWIESVRDLVAALDLALDGDVAGEAARIEAAVAEAERVLDDALLSRWLEGVYARLAAVWPAAARDAGRGDATLCRRAREVEARAARAATASDRADVDLAVTALAEVARQTPWTDEAGDEGVTDEEAAARGAGAAVEQVDDGFRPMTMDADAARRSLHALDTPDWAVEEGFRQVAFYNLARGRRDLKMLRGTREGDGGALWELRHRDGRNPVRVLYRFEGGAPRVVAVIAKQDDEHQRRMIARVRGLLEPERIEGGAQRT
jgi:hypothetical protein